MRSHGPAQLAPLHVHATRLRTCAHALSLIVAVASPLGVTAQDVDASSERAAHDEDNANGFLLDGGVLYWVDADGRSVVRLPGTARALHVVGESAYVALGELGAAVVRVSRVADRAEVSVEQRIPVSHGEVVGFMVEGESVWMQLSSTTAIRLHGEASAVPVSPVVTAPVVSQEAPSSALPPRDAPAESDARAQTLSGLAITKIWNGQVQLNRGKSSGLRVGDRLKVVRSEQVLDEGGSFAGEQEVAVLVVDTLGEESARALVWRGDRVIMGDRVELADRDTDPSLSYPRQLQGFLEVEVHVRPLLNIGAAGAGVLMNDHLTYFAEHYYLGLRNEPFGLGTSEGSTAFTQSTFVEGGYNSRPFAIGLGLGFTSVYGDLQEMFELGYASDDSGRGGAWEAGDPIYGPWTQDMQHAFALGQNVRLGSMDGLNFSVFNTLLYFPGGERSTDGREAKGGFIWGGTNAKLSVPLAQRADLFIEGGGGVMGYAYGAIGVFGWLQGNGGPGSLGLLASAGGAGVWGSRTRENRRYSYTEEDETVVAGPMISLGLRYRAGLHE